MKDGGVSKYYQIGKGWFNESYPEVSGYIIPSFLELFKKTKDKEYFERAVKIADWLVRIQDKNGNWSKKEFALGPKNKFLKLFGLFGNAHNSRTAWALLEVWKITQDEKYKNSAIKNLNWTLNQQERDGYYKHCHTYLHYLAYTASGLLESGVILNEKKYINSAILFIDHVLNILRKSDNLNGNYNKNWKAIGRKHSALTSNAQIVILLYRFNKITKEDKYLFTAEKILNFLKRNQNLHSSNLGILGGIAGSYPLNGDYCPNQILSWATKFYLDALLISSSKERNIKS
jgi:uncharacterized protein YyaL (SSP411 family)